MNKLLVGALLAGGLGASVTSGVGERTMPEQLPNAVSAVTGDGELRSLATSGGWLNSPPLTAEALRGKVVLIDFWTYTCINWLRTLPYVRAWVGKYKDQGLVVIGVHSPEFGFEKNQDNVGRAVKEMNVGYPVAIDSDHSIWRAFDNNYWPALYFVDARGKVRERQFGEGHYAEAERIIQRLLMEAGAKGVSRDLVSVEGKGAEAPADWGSLRSPENYVGYDRTEGFASPGGATRGEPRLYSIPPTLGLNRWALSGDWTMGGEATALNKPMGRVVYRFHARDLHFVMGPAEAGKSIRFRVLIDGEAPGASHGVDVNEQGYGTLTGQRMYQLIRQTGSIADRQFEIQFLDAGVEIFSFTFG
ncbi:MAG TPA: redoxin domain-containing protein [Gemmatimonadales bacterium]|jgi:thiol-disulfide isomerase/thioredoxin